MAGLAAALNAPKVIDAIAWALAARGNDGATCRLAGPGDTVLDVAIRSALPAITRVVAADTPDEEYGGEDGARAPAGPNPIAAMVVDGVTSVTALDTAYTERGPGGLVDEGQHAYAVVLADAERGELVLARNGAGPTLYYARLDEGWVVASEPGALVHAGVDPEPDIGVIRRFIQDGRCDEDDRTFFVRIRRVLPGEAIVLNAAISGPVRHPVQWTPPDEGDPADAVWTAAAGAHPGVLITPDLAGAAVLGAALHQPTQRRPLPVFTASLGEKPDLPVLDALGPEVVRSQRLTATADLSTLERFLRDLGEPVPDLGVYLLWTVARELSGDVDTLADATPGRLAGWDRVADRLLSHYGVTVRAPLRGAAPGPSALDSIVHRALAPHVVSSALGAPAGTIDNAQFLLALHRELGDGIVPPRPWSDGSAGVAALRRLAAGDHAHADTVLRAFLVERWLAAVGAQASVPSVPTDLEVPAWLTRDDQTRRIASPVWPIAEVAQVPAREPDEVVVGGEGWWRIPVRTAPIAAGDQLLANTAFYVANALTSRPQPLAGPWFAVVSGKVVAISQRRVEPISAVRPGRAARLLAPLARRRWPHLARSRTMQVAIDHSGLSRVVGAVVFGGALPAQAGVYPPRAGALAPGDAAVIRPPLAPDEVAASLVAALRLALGGEIARLLAGVAVVSADDHGCRVLGFAPGPAVDAVSRPRALLSRVLADNPAGQDAQRTPIVVVAQQAPQPLERTLRFADRHADLAARTVRLPAG